MHWATTLRTGELVVHDRRQDADEQWLVRARVGLPEPDIEAGVVRIADALDMAKGRSRIPFEQGSLSIHSVSAAAVEGVSIERGEERPVRVTVDLSNSAGLFQLDQLLREKLAGSGLEDHLEVVRGRRGDTGQGGGGVRAGPGNVIEMLQLRCLGMLQVSKP